MNALRKARQESGLSQSRLSSLADVPQSLLSAHENGRSILYPAARRKIAKVLNRPEAEIFPRKTIGDGEVDGQVN